MGTDGRTSERGTSRLARGGLRVAGPALLSAVLAVVMVPPAVADKSHGPIPTRDEVAAAEERVAETARSVGAIKASLLLANQRLEAAAVEAEMASEAYNGAMWRLQLAREELAAARAEAARARRTVAEQRGAIGALVAATYQRGGELTALSAMMSADGPEGVLDQYATFQGASESLQSDYDRFAASDAIARAFEKRAEQARVKAEDLAADARAAKERATGAAMAAQTVATQIATEKDQLIRALAQAQDISVSLARRRQAALEEIARERAATRARAAAEEAALRQAAEEARARVEARRARAGVRADQEQAATRERRQPRVTPQRESAPSEPAPPPPAPAPSLPPPPRGSGGADRAIAFAKAQLGEPYVWGAAGPDAWDCSGLMLAAWAQGGVSLPHYSVAQYYAGTPISVGDLRPGDLVFWGSSSSPESIHHVAMYIGGGQIIHAPRTGRPVAIDGLYYWTPPNFFARV